VNQKRTNATKILITTQVLHVRKAMPLQRVLISLQIHGLMYKTVIADGDSNVYQCIKHNNPYREQMVKKIECANHLLRNLCKKLQTVAATTQPNAKKT